MSLDVFESTVALSYFQGPHCVDSLVKGKASLAEAAYAVWTDLTEDDFTQVQERLREQLNSGGFFFIVAAQRFTAPMLRTIDFLNARMTGARFAAVELVAFEGEGFKAFESRTAARPAPRRTGSASEDAFLAGITDLPYRRAPGELIEFCRGQQLRFEWGSIGTSIRMLSPDAADPLTIAWLYAPEQAGYLGFRDVTLGYESGRAARHYTAQTALKTYADALAAMSDADTLTARDAVGRHFSPTKTVAHLPSIKRLIGNLVNQTNEGIPQSSRPLEGGTAVR